MNSFAMGSIEAWVPRGLVSDGECAISAPVTGEGLCPMRISWDKGKINRIEAIDSSPESLLKLLLPRLVEPHAHLDKVFTWKKFPNFKGTYESALQTNLEEHKVRTFQEVYIRAEKALKLALKNGLRAIRTHVDCFGMAGNHSWEALIDLKKKWQNLIELQCVALVPLDYWSSKEGNLLASRVARSGGILGGVLVPPFEKRKSHRYLFELLKLANQLQCGVDLHIDESDKKPAAGLNQLIRVLDHVENNIAITCSHSSSMGLLSRRKIEFLAERLAHHQVNVIALPLTNAWLLSRQERVTPIQRPVAPVKQLQQSGVTVAIGGDNVQDSWFPFGNCDPIAMMSCSMPLIQLAPWERLGLSAFTTCAAEVMGLEWDNTLQVGCPADFVVLDSSCWVEALSIPSPREIIIKGELLEDEMIPASKNPEIFDE